MKSMHLKLAYVALLIGALATFYCSRQRAIVLKRGETAVLTRFTAPDSCEALLRLRISAPVDWSDSSRVSALLRVGLDGLRSHDVLVPVARFASTTFLGPVAPGSHDVSVSLDATYTAPAVREVRILEARVRCVLPGDSLYAALAHAPYLYGRPGNEHSDAPLLMWYERSGGNQQQRILYSVIWSNEDGGTDTPDLLSRWGRTTDIEWIAEVFLGASKRVDSVLFQAPGHETTRFRGRWRGAHPVLRTCTLNNNVCHHDTSEFLFALAPLHTRAPDQPREALMDAEPWMYQVMAAELKREGKLEPVPDPSTPQPGDLHDYLFVDFGTAGDWSDVDLIFSVQTADGRWFASNHGLDSVQCVNVPGWRRTSVELPHGFTLSDLRRLRLQARADRAFSARVLGIFRLFQLDDDWQPVTYPWTWSEPFELANQHPWCEWELSNPRELSGTSTARAGGE